MKRIVLLKFALATLVLIIPLFSTGYSQNYSSKIEPRLQAVLSSANPSDLIEVYAIFQNRLTLDDLQAMTSGLQRVEKRREVVHILKSHAATIQRPVLEYLYQEENTGEVDRIEIIWAVNVIGFHATPRVITTLASSFPEIEIIKYDPPIPLEEMLDDNGYSRNGTPVAPTATPQQGLILINAPLVWAEGDSGQGVIVANVDTGTDWDHPDLVNNIWNNPGEDADGDGRTLVKVGNTWMFDPDDINGIDDDGNGKVDDFIGWDFTSNDNNPDDLDGHGTATAGLVAGDGTSGTATGVAPRAKIMVLRAASGGQTVMWASYQYAFENGADVTTSSLSLKWGPHQPDYATFRAMTDMELAAGLVHTNSTGNQGNQSTPGCNNNYPIPYNISTPGNCPSAWIHPDQGTLIGGVSSVIGCGNVNAFTDIIEGSSGKGPAAWEDIWAHCPNYPYNNPPSYWDYPWSRQSPTEPDSIGLLKPDVSAPGSGTTSTSLGGGYTSFGGTSAATPHVGGTVALMLSVNPNLTPEDVSRILQTTAIEKGAPGKDDRYGAGRIDAYQAYLQSLAEAGAPEPPLAFQAYSDYQTPNGMQLSWTNPTHLVNGDSLTPDAFHMVIERDGTVIDSVTGGISSYFDSGLLDGQYYSYQIFARVDSTGKTSEGISAGWIAGGSPVPNPVSAFTVGGGQNEVTFYWTAPTENLDGTPMDDYAGIRVYQNGVAVTDIMGTPADTGAALSATYTPNPAGLYEWYVTVIDNESPQNESIPSDTVGTPLNIPFGDTFDIPGDPNPAVWSNHYTDINDQSVNPPSGTYALNLNGKPAGEDIIELKPLDLTGMEGTGITLSYWYQPQGNGNAPEVEDSLRVYFKNDLGNWIRVKAYPGTTLVPFALESISLDSVSAGGGTFFFSQFQIRFRSTGSSGEFPNDNWFIDDVTIGNPLGIGEKLEIAKEFILYQNYPNPFNPTTIIAFSVPQPSRVTLQIFDITGKRIRTLINREVQTGRYKMNWDGKNEQGYRVASGIYLYRLKAENNEMSYVQTRKMMLLK